MEINLSYDQLNDEYSMLLSVLGASVSKHLLDKHFTCIWANDYYYELIGYPKPEYERRFHNHCDEYFFNNPEGWKLLMDKVRSSLQKGESGYSVYLPMLTPRGETYWVKLQSAFMDEYIRGYRVAYTTMTDVTEMVRARQEQEYTQRIYQKMTQEQEMLMGALNVSVSKHLIDEHYTCVWANKYYYKLIGYEKDRYEALFHNHADEFYANNPEGWALLSAKVASVLEKGEDQYELIVPMKYEDGTSFWVKLFSYFTDEYIEGLRTSYTVMTDVTELVQMKNEQEMLMGAMKVSVSRHLVDEHFTVVWANDFYYQIIGYSKEEYQALFNNHCDAYFHDNWDSWNGIHSKIAQMFAEGKKSYEAFIPLRIPDGSTSWVKMVGFFTDNYQDGKQVAYTTMVSVTDMMHIQQEKTIAYHNIPGFIVKYRILPHSILMIEASERIQDIFDINVHDLGSVAPYSILEPDSREVMEANHPNFRKGLPFEGTIRMKDKHGRVRWFQIHCTCIDTIADDPVYMTVFIDITDITELRELQSKLEERTRMLNAALEEASQASMAKSDFLSRMSHDIRTPMNVIVGMTEIADAHLTDNGRVKDCLQKIRLSSHHLLGLINDVLDMSQIENGKFHINVGRLSLPEVLREVTMITMAGIRERGQIFGVHVMDLENEQFLSDALRLRQILLNLLSNACKFTPRGGRIVFEIQQLSGSQEESAIKFTVTDTGAGMSPEFKDHIFEAFTREQDSRTDRIEGSGLGMCITKRLVDMLEGTITVDSQTGLGTSFQVILPMKPAPAHTPPPLPKVSILLVDHDPVVLKYGCRALGALGMEAEGAQNLDQAVASIRQRRQEGRGYRMVILDSDMPQPEARDVIRQILDDYHWEVQLILSSYEGRGAMGDFEYGITGCIEKPFFYSTLRSCLSEYLEGEALSEGAREIHDFSGKIFLLAEDNELNREIAVELLGTLGAKMELAFNGREALGRFRESPPSYYDLILMDIQMPQMNGYEAARAIRALTRPDAASVPIIAMTADAFVQDIQNARAAGMNGHIAKPLDYGALCREIGKYLSQA